MPNETNVNIGNSGEYFVAGELERRGFTDVYIKDIAPNIEDCYMYLETLNS